MREKFNIKKNDKIVVFKDFDEIRVDFDGELTKENMENFFKLESGKWDFKWD